MSSSGPPGGGSGTIGTTGRGRSESNATVRTNATGAGGRPAGFGAGERSDSYDTRSLARGNDNVSIS